jgi:hypothetical protein
MELMIHISQLPSLIGAVLCVSSFFYSKFSGRAGSGRLMLERVPAGAAPPFLDEQAVPWGFGFPSPLSVSNSFPLNSLTFSPA